MFLHINLINTAHLIRKCTMGITQTTNSSTSITLALFISLSPLSSLSLSLLSLSPPHSHFKYLTQVALVQSNISLNIKR